MNLYYSPLDPLPWRCPCGAHAEKKYGLCRKCNSRDAWQRHVARPRRVRRTFRRLFQAVSK
ncbi:hypothetical protein [Actinomadura sp. DC4]|uniref:hypothetical protein n=1 Tax=Actinomadura sp. DC4 TaxID=3055069 RepID=UPI0025AF2623|nr:hypothetical protein [Actinomadura sp. DC4]MDN3355850.1 hypothetical protein [Actinomadura sp. DC4]